MLKLKIAICVNHRLCALRRFLTVQQPHMVVDRGRQASLSLERRCVACNSSGSTGCELLGHCPQWQWQCWAQAPQPFLNMVPEFLCLPWTEKSAGSGYSGMGILYPKWKGCGDWPRMVRATGDSSPMLGATVIMCVKLLFSQTQGILVSSREPN